MSIYGVAIVNRHGNVGHRFAGSGCEGDRCHRKRGYECFHSVSLCCDVAITRAALADVIAG
jgi:hypothetical protein